VLGQRIAGQLSDHATGAWCAVIFGWRFACFASDTFYWASWLLSSADVFTQAKRKMHVVLLIDRDYGPYMGPYIAGE
jgi:hypothetical protein